MHTCLEMFPKAFFSKFFDAGNCMGNFEGQNKTLVLTFFPLDKKQMCELSYSDSLFSLSKGWYEAKYTKFPSPFSF